MTDDPFLSQPGERAQPAQPSAQPSAQPGQYLPEPVQPAQEIPAPPPTPPAPSVPPPAPVYAQPGYAQQGYTQPGVPAYPASAYPPPPLGYGGPKPKTWMNWTAFGCGLGALFTCGMSAIPAIVFGHLGLSAVKRGEADQRGIGLTGLILGYVIAVLGAAYWVFIIALAAMQPTT